MDKVGESVPSSGGRERRGEERGERAEEYVFVTVGTTRFDDLIGRVFSEKFAAAVRDVLSVTHIRVQVGRSLLPSSFPAPSSSSSPSIDWTALDSADSSGVVTVRLYGVVYEVYRYKPSIAADLASASLIISHAGSGSIFESLRSTSPNEPAIPLIVVINDKLADNHQIELAERLARDGHLRYCLPADVHLLIAREGKSEGKGLPPPDTSRFVLAMNEVVGWEGLLRS